MLDINSLLTAADRFKQAAGIARDVTLSHRIFGDSKRLTALRAGGEITVGRFNLAMTWMAQHWPSEAEMPESLAGYRVDQSNEAAA